MKIADVNPFYYPYKGGIERRMHDTAVRLAAEGHEVTVVTGRLSEDDPEEEKTEGYRIIRLKSRQLKLYNPPYISSKGVGEAVESLDPDVVNFNYRWAPSYTKAMRAYDGKKVFTYHNMWGEGMGIAGALSRINDSRFDSSLRSFDHIIAVSGAVRDDLIARGYPERYVTAVPTCLDRPVEPGSGSGDFALSLGRLVATKGLGVLMEAMKQVDHRLIVCGKGPEEKKLRRLISKYGLEDRVEMRGFVSDEEKRELMGSCRFFVMPSMTRVGLNEARFLSFCSRYASCWRICSTVDDLLSLNHGESFAAQFLHRLPSLSFRLPSRPMSFPQMLHCFLSNSPIIIILLLPQCFCGYSVFIIA